MAFRLVLWHGIRTGQCPKKEEMTMTKENAKELQVDLAKDALVLLTLHGEMDVQFHGGGEERRPPADRIGGRSLP